LSAFACWLTTRYIPNNKVGIGEKIKKYFQKGLCPDWFRTQPFRAVNRSTVKPLAAVITVRKVNDRAVALGCGCSSRGGAEHLDAGWQITGSRIDDQPAKIVGH